MHSAALCALTLVLVPSNAIADSVTLKNGDIITGTIRDITQPQGLQVQASFGQNVLIPWENVAEMRNEKGIALPIFAPYQQPQNQVYVEQPLTASQTQRFTQTQRVISDAVTTYSLDDGSATNHDALALVTTTPSAPQVIAPAPIVEPTFQTIEITEAPSTPAPAAEAPAAPTSSFLGAVWSGRVDAGFTNQSGNTDSEAYGLDGQLKAKWGDKHRASIKAEYDFEEENNVTTEDERQLDLAYDYFFAPKWFANATAGFEQDDIANLDLRSKYGLGLGWQPYESDELNLQITAGPSYISTEFANASTEDEAAAGWALDYDQRVWNEAFQIFHNHDVDFPLDNTDAYLLETETGIRMPIRGGITATAQLDYDLDGEPATGAENDDATYSLKLGYEW